MVDIVIRVFQPNTDSIQTIQSILYNTKQEINLILVKSRKGNCENGNIGLERCKTDIIGILDDDILVPKDWLTPLLEDFRNYPEIGVVSPKIVGFNGETQNVTSKLPENELWESWISSSCCLIRNIGVRFDENYKGSQCEDLDLFWQIKKKGYITVCDTRVVVKHKQKLTNQNFQVNKKYFVKKWGFGPFDGIEQRRLKL